jgi:hypothetical protein
MATAAGVNWHGTDRAMAQRVADYRRRLLEAVFRLASEWADRIAADAKASAPWTDRSGLARRTILGRALRLAMGAVIVISGGAPWSIYLERRWGGKWAAILPALQRAYAAVMASLQALVA